MVFLAFPAAVHVEQDGVVVGIKTAVSIETLCPKRAKNNSWEAGVVKFSTASCAQAMPMYGHVLMMLKLTQPLLFQMASSY